MKLIKPSFEIINQTDLFKHIEMAARTCYKSEDKITDDSSAKMIEKLTGTNPPHTAMLEHGTVYLTIPNVGPEGNNRESYYRYRFNKYSKENISSENIFTGYVTTNYRVLVENGWLDDLQFSCEPTEFHEKRITVKFICDRGVSHEFVRHRVFSFAQESTRYCNYSKDKFGSEITFIQPCWEIRGTNFIDMLQLAEKDYLELLEVRGWKPQQARAVLPNSLKTELVMTGFVSDWEGFFILRDAVTAHPQAYELAHPLHKKFIELGYGK